MCDLTHSRVIVGQGFGQLTGCQEFTAHLQVVLNLNMSCPQNTCSIKTVLIQP